MKKVFVVNGPNINLLGKREPQIYGTTTWADIETSMKKYATENALELEFFQSNHEGEIIDYLQNLKSDSYIVINPAGLSHNSISLRDCIAAIQRTTIEVHISNIASRENFRSNSIITSVCTGIISGLGHHSYRLALNWIKEN